MIARLLELLADLAAPWGYLVVGVLTLLEASAMVGLVVPGEAALLVGGFLASQGNASLWVMMAVGAVGAIVGDSIGYEIGRHLGPALSRSRLGRWVGDERWERAEGYLSHHGGRAVFFGRFVGVLRAMVPTLAGLSRMPYRTFLPWNVAGALVWGPGFVLLGYAAGGSYHKVAEWSGRAGAVLLALVLVVVALIVGARAVVRREGAVRTWARTQAERPLLVRLRARFERQLSYVGRRLRPDAAFGLSLTASLAAVAVTGWAFGVVVVDVISRKDLAGVDGEVYRFFLAHRAPYLTTASRVMGFLGGAVVLSLVTMAGAAVVWWRTRKPRDLVLPAVAMLGSTILVEVIKVAIARPRPPAAGMLGAASGFAFPSGQSTRVTACFLVLAFTVCGVFPSWRAKVVTVTAAVAVVLLVGVARLTLGVHWLTDVLGGWALGTLWSAAVVVLSQVAESLHRREAADRQEVAVPP